MMAIVILMIGEYSKKWWLQVFSSMNLLLCLQSYQIWRYSIFFIYDVSDDVIGGYYYYSSVVWDVLYLYVLCIILVYDEFFIYNDSLILEPYLYIFQLQTTYMMEVTVVVVVAADLLFSSSNSSNSLLSSSCG